MYSGKRDCSGFSLIELMVVVAVIGILAAVAYPSYTEYIQRSRIADATAGLSDIRIRMERYFQDNRTYAAGGECGVAMPTVGSFEYVCEATDTTFLVTATGGNAMSDFEFDVDQDNNRRTTKFPGVTSTQNCWMTKRGDSC